MHSSGVPGALRALAVAAALASVASQCSFSSCSSCASQSSCVWCAAPAYGSGGGHCIPSYSSCNSDEAEFPHSFSCPSASSCSLYSSCTSCAAAPSCEWLAPVSSVSSSAAGCADLSVSAPSGWFTYLSYGSCSNSAAIAALSGGIVAAIIAGVLLLVVLPLALWLACVCGVAGCCAAAGRRPHRGTVVVMQSPYSGGVAVSPDQAQAMMQSQIAMQQAQIQAQQAHMAQQQQQINAATAASAHHVYAAQQAQLQHSPGPFSGGAPPAYAPAHGGAYTTAPPPYYPTKSLG